MAITGILAIKAIGAIIAIGAITAPLAIQLSLQLGSSIAATRASRQNVDITAIKVMQTITSITSNVLWPLKPQWLVGLG